MRQVNTILNDGGNSSEIKINFDEMEQLMTHISTLKVTLLTKVMPNVNNLAQVDFYDGGMAARAMDFYPIMINKVEELSELYIKAMSEIERLIEKWIETDENLRRKFEQINPNGLFRQNQKTLIQYLSQKGK